MAAKKSKKKKKTGKNFRGGGEIFLAGQNIYPCGYLFLLLGNVAHDFVPELHLKK